MRELIQISRPFGSYDNVPNCTFGDEKVSRGILRLPEKSPDNP